MEYFVISGRDNGAFYFDPDDGAPACSVCRLADRLDWVNPGFGPPPRTWDFGYTYDLMPIASGRFAEVCHRIEGARFLDLPSAPGWFLVVVDRTVPDDGDATMRREVPCPRCERFTAVGGPRPTLLDRPPSGFSATTSVYGSASDHWDEVRAQTPRLIIDEPLRRLIEAADLSGLDIVHTYDVAPS